MFRDTYGSVKHKGPPIVVLTRIPLIIRAPIRYPECRKPPIRKVSMIRILRERRGTSSIGSPAGFQGFGASRV